MQRKFPIISYSLMKGIQMQSQMHSLAMILMNESINLLMDEMIYEINQILNCGYEIK